MASVMRKYSHFTAHERPTVGDMKMSGVNVDHLGWLLCDGREVSVMDYFYLHQVIGYSFGGADLSFNLPNASGRVPGMIGQSVGKNWVMGDLSGEETHTLTIPEMPGHNHGGQTDLSESLISINSDGTHSHTQTTVNDDFNNSSTYPNSTKPSYSNYDGAGSVTWTETINSNGAHTHGVTDPQHRHGIQTQGGDQPHNNMQPTIFVGNMFIYCGKNRLGVFPSTRGQIVF